MTTWLVDTNVILDVIGADQTYGPLSTTILADCAEAGVLVINPIIYAEVGVWVATLEELDSLLPADLFRRESLPWEAAYLAAQAFGRYRQAGGRRERMLADFMIGAHAAAAGYTLLTRDKGYAHYFDLELTAPAATGKP